MPLPTEEQRLHDQHTRGETLTVEEKTRLDAWYRFLDAEEEEMLRNSQPVAIEGTLRVQLEGLLQELTQVTRQIQQTSGENEALRQEIYSLRQGIVSERNTARMA